MVTLPPVSVGSPGEGPRRESAEQLERAALHEYLQIPSDQRVTYYTLLGIKENELDAKVIENAAEMRMKHLRDYQTHPTYGTVIQKILNDVAKARITLLDAEKRAAYDERLRASEEARAAESLRRRTAASSHDKIAAVVPVAVPMAVPMAEPPALIVVDENSRSARPTSAESRISTFVNDWRIRLAGGAVAVGSTLGIGAYMTTSGKGESRTVAQAPDEPARHPRDTSAAAVTLAGVSHVAAKEEERFTDAQTSTPSAQPENTVPVAKMDDGNSTASDAGAEAPTSDTPAAAPAPSVEADGMPEPERPAYVPKEAVWNPDTGSWYLFIPGRMTYPEAQQIAAARNATVVIPNTPEENAFVLKLRRGTEESTWLGIVKGNDGKLYGIDGTPIPYENWRTNEGANPQERNVFMGQSGKHMDGMAHMFKNRVCLEWKHPANANQAVAAIPVRTGLQDLLERDAGRNPANEVKMADIDKEEFNRMRASLRESVKNASGPEKIDAVLAFGSNPVVLRQPEAIKAVYAEAFLLSIEAKDHGRATRTYEKMKGLPALFDENERAWSLNQVLALMKRASEEQDIRRVNKSTERQAIAKDMLALLDDVAANDPSAAIALLPDIRKCLGYQPKDTKAEFERQFDAIEADLEKLKAARERAEREEAEFERLNDALKLNPGDLDARRERGGLLLSRGDVSGGLKDLAESNDEQRDLARATMALLENANAGGAQSYDAARAWEDLAGKEFDGRKAAMRKIAIMLYDIAIRATNDRLDPFKYSAAQRSRDALDAAGSLQPGPVMRGQDDAAEKPKEPVRPRNVPEAAVYFQGSWYMAVDKAMPIQDALALAAQHGATLADAPTAEHNAFIASLIPPGRTQAYLGAQKVYGRWVDKTGNPIPYHNWRPGEPTGARDEILLIMGRDGGHNDLYPTEDTDVTIPILEWEDGKHVARR